MREKRRVEEVIGKWNFNTSETWFCCVKKITTLGGQRETREKSWINDVKMRVKEEWKRIRCAMKEEGKSEKGREEEWGCKKKKDRMIKLLLKELRV